MMKYVLFCIFSVLLVSVIAMASPELPGDDSRADASVEESSVEVSEPVEDVSSESPVEDTPDDSVSDEVSDDEETPVDAGSLDVEEPPSEELPVEALPVEELPAEEPPAEEPPAEELPSEEPSDEELTVDIIESPGDDSSSGMTFSFEEEEAPIVYDTDNPLPVVVLEPDDSFPTVYSSRSGLDLVIDDTPPVSPPFYGSGFVTGSAVGIGTVTLYFPINYKEGYWGVDSNGYLFNVTSSSMTGYFEEGYNNSVNAPSFSYPRYRQTSISDYTTIYLTPESSNMQIATDNAPRVSIVEVFPFVTILLLGVIIICFMRRS